MQLILSKNLKAAIDSILTTHIDKKNIVLVNFMILYRVYSSLLVWA